MLFELCNDTIDTVCHHLNLASALHLASIAKSILGLGARLRRHADKSAQKIQRAFRRHYSWPLGLRSMAKTLNPAAVAFQAHRAKAAILARFKGLDLDLLEQSETSVHAQAASMQMQTFVTILHEVCEETLPPLPAWKQSAATACVGELIKTLLELGEDVGNLVQNWDDQEVVDGQDELFAHTFPSGDEIMSLRVYLAQMQIWNGWCYRGEQMMSIILDASGLLGCALTFYSLHGWDYTGGPPHHHHHHHPDKPVDCPFLTLGCPTIFANPAWRCSKAPGACEEMVWIVLAAIPLTAARTVSQLRPPLMRPHVQSSITYSGSLPGRVSVVMQAKSVATFATTQPQGLPLGLPPAAAAPSENLFNVTRLGRKYWSCAVAVLAGCLLARDRASTVGGLVQVGVGFVKSNYKGLMALVGGHGLLMRFGVYEMVPKIFGVASSVDMKAMKEDMKAMKEDMKAGFEYVNASFAALHEALSVTVKKDSREWKDVEEILWRDTFDSATFAVTQSAAQYDIVVLDQDGKQPLHKKLPETLRCVLTLLQPAAQGDQTFLVLEARTNDQSDMLVRHMDVTNIILGQLTHLSGKPEGHAPPRFSRLMKGNDFPESGRYELSVP